MTGLIRKATLLSACALLVATAAMAGVPSPGNCTAPSFTRVVGSLTTTTVPDSITGKFTVIVRDLANNPINGSNVVLDYSGCSDIHIASNQINVNYLTNCTTHSVSAYTNSAGTVAFTILGSSSGVAATVVGCSKIYADGVLLASPTVASFDLDGASGVNTSDLSVWLSDNGKHIYYGRDDYDANSAVNTSDLSVWLAINGAHRSAVTDPVCP